MTVSVLRFDRFELQPRERLLLADGVPAALGARAFDVLLALVARPGRLVTKQELLDEVWRGLVVEEANLTVQVSALRKVLGGELIATIPGRGYRFTGRIEADEPAPAGAAAAPAAGPGAAAAGAPAAAPGPAPVTPPSPAVRLIGREADLADAEAALAEPGCLTLVGPAGVGKTALARALAADPSGALRRAAGADVAPLWIDLAALTDGAQLTVAMTRALGIADPGDDVTGALVRGLGARALVLDNAEHVIDAAAALVAALRAAAPALRVLVTSQLRLAVADERVQRLDPLMLPQGSDTLDAKQGAVALLAERIRAADHRFEPGPAQLPLLREIGRRLDGLPLALEMAAARVPALGLAGVAQSLGERFELLTRGRRDAAARHRTLRDALAWSHGLLTADEQRLYRLCGVFTGGFALELLVDVVEAFVRAAGTAETGDPRERRWHTLDTLGQLVERSLVVAEPVDPPRYHLLETMRDDARRRLAEAGEADAAAAALAAALAGIAVRAFDPGGPPGRWRADQARLAAEHDNVRESIAWALAHDPVAALQIVTATAAAATFTAWRLEAVRWLESAAAIADDPAVPPAWRAECWHERARQRLMSRSTDAGAMAERALAVAREVGSERLEWKGLSNLIRATNGKHPDTDAVLQAMRDLLARHPEWPPSYTQILSGVEAIVCDARRDWPGLLDCRRRELEWARRLGDENGAVAVETNLVFALQLAGHADEALAQSRSLVERLGDSTHGNAAYAWLGFVMSLRERGRFEELRAVAPKAAPVMRLHGLWPYLCGQYALMLAAEPGREADAALLIGRARAAYAAGGMEPIEDDRRQTEADERRLAGVLGEAELAARLAEGAAMEEAAAERVALQAGAARLGTAAPTPSIRG